MKKYLESLSKELGTRTTEYLQTEIDSIANLDQSDKNALLFLTICLMFCSAALVSKERCGLDLYDVAGMMRR